MRYVIITGILALGLAGCNLNGLSYDLSGLPSLNIDELNCNNCNVNVKFADDDQQNVEKHYFATEAIVYLGSNPEYTISSRNIDFSDYSWFTGKKYQKKYKWQRWHYGSKEATDSRYGNVPSRVDVNGDLGLFIEYNHNPNTEAPKDTGIDMDSYFDDSAEFYILTGGDFERNYTPMPSGIYQYNGNVVSTFYARNTIDTISNGNVNIDTFSNGTVNAEANFTDNVMSIEFEGISIVGDYRFENVEIDIENGAFLKQNDEGDVVGFFLGMEAKGMIGSVYFGGLKGQFAAERSDTQVVAEN